MKARLSFYRRSSKAKYIVRTWFNQSITQLFRAAVNILYYIANMIPNMERTGTLRKSVNQIIIYN